MIFVLILCAVVAIYFYVKQCRNYWQKQGVPVVNSDTKSLVNLIRGRRSLEEMFEEMYKSFPNEPYLGSYDLKLQPSLFIRDPFLIHQILVKDFTYFHDRGNTPTVGGRLIQNVAVLEGDDWKTVRNKLLPTFSSSKLKRMFSLIDECAETLVEQHFRVSAKTNRPLDVQELAACFTLDVIGKCAFSLQFNTLVESDSLYRQVAKTMKSMGLKTTNRMLLESLSPKLLKWFGLNITTDEIEKFFFNLLHGAEDLRRRQHTEHPGDFLQLMLDAKNEEDSKAKHLFTEDRVASNMFMIFGGNETTADTIAFALYELTLHPEVQEKLRTEIAKAREANNGVMDYTTINNIAYLEMVVSETLRLHEPLGFSGRMCTATYQIPGSSVVIKPGVRVIFSTSALHKDEAYFPDPLKFDPERFSAENIARMNPYVYQPFGNGPRICLGLRFAKLAIKICLTSIVSHFKLLPCDKTEVPVVLKKTGFFHSAQNGIWLSAAEI